MDAIDRMYEALNAAEETLATLECDPDASADDIDRAACTVRKLEKAFYRMLQ